MIQPKKSLGQNFLKDNNVVKKIIKAIDIYDNKILEIGPGLGILTENILIKKPKKFIIIEKDLYLYQKLKKKFNEKKIHIINDDFFNYDLSKLKKFIIISNLPYNLSTKILINVIKLNQNFTEIICMIQSELAEKFDYKKNKMNKYKFLSEYCSEYKILFDVSPNVFYPKPKVKSKVVRFKLKNKEIDINKLNQFINLFFLNKRKKIKSNKYFKNIIEKKIEDKRYEDLKFNEVLNIYERFDFFIS